MFLISFCLQEEFYQFSRVCLRPRSFKESLYLESVSDQAMPSHVVSLDLLAILPVPSFLSQRFQHLDRHLIKSFQFLLGKFVFVVLEKSILYLILFFHRDRSGVLIMQLDDQFDASNIILGSSALFVSKGKFQVI